MLVNDLIYRGWGFELQLVRLQPPNYATVVKNIIGKIQYLKLCLKGYYFLQIKKAKQFQQSVPKKAKRQPCTLNLPPFQHLQGCTYEFTLFFLFIGDNFAIEILRTVDPPKGFYECRTNSFKSVFFDFKHLLISGKEKKR